MKEKSESRKIAAKIIGIIITLMMMTTCGSAPVLADESDAMPDLSGGPYSLTMNIKSTNPDATQTGIRGAKISIFQVASLEVKNTGAYYTAIEEFASSETKFEGMSAAESNSAAKLLAKIVKDKNMEASGISAESSDTGEVKFSDLSAGIYLVMLDRYDSSDARYTEMEPFLALVPGIDKSGSGNKWIDNVSVSPKIAISPKDYLEVNPPVVKKVEGNDNAKDVFTFELAADDVTNPMPVGARDGRKQTTINGAGESEFGIWRYTEPGTYKYTIHEIPGTNKNYRYDERVYHLTDKVSYSGGKLQLERTVVDEDGNTYENEIMDFKFVNVYNKSRIPGMAGAPKTGDNFQLLIWMLIALASGTIAIIIATRKKRIFRKE